MAHVITITTPTNYGFTQRNALTGIGKIAITGTVAGIVGTGDIEASLAGGAYTTIATGVSDGAYSGTLPSYKGQGTLTVRVVSTPDPTGSATKTFVTVGDAILCIGQSNMSGRGTNNQIPASFNTSSYTPILYGNDNTFKALLDPSDSAAGQVYTVSSDAQAAGAYVTILAALLQSQTNVPICLIPCALGGSTSAGWLPSGATPDTLTTSLFGASVVRAKQVCGTVPPRHIICHQGESGVVATYTADWTNTANRYASTLQVRPRLVLLQYSPSQSVADVDAIRADISAMVTAGILLPGPDFGPLPVTPPDGDNQYHYISNSALLACAQAWVPYLTADIIAVPSSASGDASDDWASHLNRWPRN